MKKIYPFVSVLPGIGGLIWFLWRVGYLASLHTDAQISAPFLWVIPHGAFAYRGSAMQDF